MHFLSALLIALLYSFACLSWGAFLVPLLLKDDEEHPFVMAGSFFLLGQAVIAALLQLLALASYHTEIFIIALLILGSIPGAKRAASSLYQVISASLNLFKSWFYESLEWKALIFLSLVLIGFFALAAFSPPQPRGDALAYYLALPRLIAATGTHDLLEGYADFSSITMQGEYHFAALISLHSYTAAKLFVLPVTIAGCWMLAGIGKMVGLQRRGLWVLIACVFTSRAFSLLMWDGKTDLFGAAVGLAAYFWAMQCVPATPRRGLALAGLFTGFAIIAKLSYASFLPITIVILIAWRLTADQPRFTLSTWRKITPLLVSLICWMVLPGIPHMIRNTVLFEEPLAPVIILQEEHNVGVVDQTWFSPQTTRKIIALYPVSLVFGTYTGQGGNLSPFLLILFPLILLLPFSPRFFQSDLAQITLVALLAVFIWMLTQPSVIAPRYLLAPLLLLFLPLAYATEDYLRRHPNTILAGSIFISLMLVLSLAAAREKDLVEYSIKRVLGKAGECDLEWMEKEASCESAQIIAQTAQPGSQVLLGSYYSFWLREDLLQCFSQQSILGDNPGANPQNSWELLYQQGIEYVVIDLVTHAGLRDWLPLETVPAWLQVTPLLDKSSYLLYRLEANNAPVQPAYQCVKVNDRQWDIVRVES